MVARALDAGVPAGWVGDELYGQSSGLRGELEARQVGRSASAGCRLQPPLFLDSVVFSASRYGEDEQVSCLMRLAEGLHGVEVVRGDGQDLGPGASA